MNSSHLVRVVGTVALALVPLIAPAANVSWMPASQTIVRGQLGYVDLRLSGLAEETVWFYRVSVAFDPSIVRLGPIRWGDSVTGDQLACPGPTAANCTHLGSMVSLDFGHGYAELAEASNLEHLTRPMDQLQQADDFIVLRLGFLGLAEGATDLTADLYFEAWPPLSVPLAYLPTATARIDVMAPEPSSWLLGLSGVAALLAARRPGLPSRR